MSAFSMAACTNAVVAICVVLVLVAAVGAVGVPVSAGDATGAALLRVVTIAGDITPAWEVVAVSMPSFPSSAPTPDAIFTT